MHFSQEIIQESNRHGCIDYGKLLIVDESCYSCLMPHMAKQVIDAIVKLLGKRPNSFIDATANIGCDSINFIKSFDIKGCIAIEHDAKTHDCLDKNLTMLVGDDHIRSYHGDCIEFINGFKSPVDFIYFDPPWGGPDYWKTKKLMLYLSNRSMVDVVKHTFDQKFTDVIVIKVPSNFDMRTFTKGVDANITVSPIYKKKKRGRVHIAYNLICVKRR